MEGPGSRGLEGHRKRKCPWEQEMTSEEPDKMTHLDQRTRTVGWVLALYTVSKFNPITRHDP